MSEKSSIEWTNATWNPVTGCTEVSPGCDHCYARTLAERFRGTIGHPYQQGFDLTLWPARLDIPTRWKRPRKIFVNSMSDLFHKQVPDRFIVSVFHTMAHRAPQHTYQVLTKRPSRLVNTSLLAQITDALGPWPAHIWLGVSVETQDYTWRVDMLRKAPAPVKFISAEPLLGSIQFDLDSIAWMIVGTESGHRARPMDEQWVRLIRDQCCTAHVPLFYKQNALRGRKLPLPLLDGERWQQFPTEVPHD